MEQLAQDIKNKKQQIFDYVVSTDQTEQQLFQGRDGWYLQLKEDLTLLLKNEEQIREKELFLLRKQAATGNLPLI